MLRLAQQLLLEGHATYDRRRIGLVYDPVEITVPADAPTDAVDFWAADAIALPLRAGSFGRAAAVNLVDCIAAPTNMLHEAARVLAPAAPAFFTTPYDWSQTATEASNWLGGHSARAPHAGAGEPVLTATLAQAGFEVIAEEHDVPWDLRMHARAVTSYRLHLVGVPAGGVGRPHHFGFLRRPGGAQSAIGCPETTWHAWLSHRSRAGFQPAIC